MEPAHAKEVLDLLDRVHLFAMHNNGDGPLKHVHRKLGCRHYYSLKETNISFFYR